MNDIKSENLEIYIAAIRETGKASTSFLREKFSIGYGRADKIVRELERRKIVSKAIALTNQESGNCVAPRGGQIRNRNHQGRIRQISAETKSLEKNTIGVANIARSIGIRLQTFNAGKKQIDLHFWEAKCDGILPFDFETGKLFVSVANKNVQAGQDRCRGGANLCKWR